MRITRRTSLHDCGPYNTIFEAFGPELGVIFEPRPRPMVYVPVPEAEKGIKTFTESKSSSIGLIVGDIGIGKTTVLSHFKDTIWPDRGCKVLFRDMATISASPQLGPDFRSLSGEGRAGRATDFAIRVLSDVLKVALADVYEQLLYSSSGVPLSGEFLRFTERYFGGRIHSKYKIHLPNRERHAEIVESLIDDADIEFNILLLCFQIDRECVSHVKVVLDNIDDKDVEVLRALSEQCAHLARKVSDFSQCEQGVDSSKPRRSVSSLLACRPATAELLEQPDPTRPRPWYSYHRVEWDPRFVGTIIGDIIKSRSKRVTFPNELRFSAGRHPWTHEAPEDLFYRIIDSFVRTGQAQDVVNICNYNLADAMKAIYGVIRNRHFTDDGTVLADTYPRVAKPYRMNHGSSESGENASPFTATSVLRALAYGNQGNNDPQYPIVGTYIPNVIESKRAGLLFGESTLKPRVLGLCHHREKTSKLRAISMREIVKYATDYFNIDGEQAARCVDDMFLDQLIVNSAVWDIPSKVGGDCMLSLSPRGQFLWERVSADNILLTCYHDDVELKNGLKFDKRVHNWSDEGAQSKLLFDSVEATFWMVIQLWRCEVGELSRIAGDVRREFIAVSGSEPLSSRFLSGVRATCQHFGRMRVLTHTEAEAIERMCDKLDVEISSWWKEWCAC